MSKSNITIHLHNYEYYPGSRISGEAICYFRSPKDFRKIRIRLQGLEHTHWTNQESYYDNTAKAQRTRTVYYNGDHDILLVDKIVHGEGNLPRGEYRFPIDFQLPDDLPSSYQCAYGHIKYVIQVTVDLPLKVDLEAFKQFSVPSLIRVQDMPPRMLCPVELSDEKAICCFCCAGGNIEMAVNMKKKAFVIGQKKHIKVYCLNMSNSNVEGLEVKLTQKIRYKVTHPSSDYKHDSEHVATSFNDGVGAHGDRTYNIELEVPPSTVVPNFAGCELFECRYELKVTACISGCHTNLDIETDASVGHIPHPNLPQQDASSWETLDQCVVEPLVTNQPMPMPGDYGSQVPPYPFAEASAPSAAQADAPSAPTKADVLDTTSGRENSSTMEPPPPTYDEATSSYSPPKKQ